MAPLKPEQSLGPLYGNEPVFARKGKEFMAQYYVGIDVAKEYVDVHRLPDGFCQRFQNDRAGIEACVKAISGPAPALVVVEATGGYEFELVCAMQEADIAVAVVNPRRIRDFARASGQLAKTDALDAAVIAGYAARMQPPVSEEMDRRRRLLKGLVARRSQLTGMHVAEQNRLEHVHDKAIGKSIEAIIAAIQRQLKEVEDEIRKQIGRMPELKDTQDTIKSVPGIGENTSAMLVAHVPELGRLNRRQIASLVGLAPMARDSGKLRGKRMTGGGRTEVRKMLFMPTLVAIRHNQPIRAFYERLVLAGKPKMTAVVACMRKLLTLINLLVAKKEHWKPNPA